jgi:hypothetical protein
MFLLEEGGAYYSSPQKQIKSREISFMAVVAFGNKRRL